MNPNELLITLHDSPAEAPTYKAPIKAIDLSQAVIVGKGMESGKPTVDFLFTDADGNKYVTMLTGAVVEALGQAVMAKRLTDEG